MRNVPLFELEKTLNTFEQAAHNVLNSVGLFKESIKTVKKSLADLSARNNIQDTAVVFPEEKPIHETVNGMKPRNEGTKRRKRRLYDWPKLIRLVLVNQERTLTEAFENLHAMKKMTFRGDAEKKYMRERLKQALYRLEKTGHAKRMKGGYNSTWTWCGGAIM